MNRLESRLRRLEKIIGERGACHCGRDGKPSMAVYYPDEGQAHPSVICPTCGGKRMIVAIVYESQWRSNDSTMEQRPINSPFNKWAGYE